MLKWWSRGAGSGAWAIDPTLGGIGGGSVFIDGLGGSSGGVLFPSKLFIGEIKPSSDEAQIIIVKKWIRNRKKGL